MFQRGKTVDDATVPVTHDDDAALMELGYTVG